MDLGPSNVIKYADDDALIIPGRIPEDMVQQAQLRVDEIVEWGRKLGLRYNAGKTQVMFCHRGEHFDVRHCWQG